MKNIVSFIAEWWAHIVLWGLVLTALATALALHQVNVRLENELRAGLATKMTAPTAPCTIGVYDGVGTDVNATNTAQFVFLTCPKA